MSTPSLSSLVLLLAVLFIHSEAASSRCQEVRDPGDASCGKKSATRFYFDHRTERCQPFLYQGCAGNRNRFFNRTECESACADADGSAPTYERKVCKNGVNAAVDAQGVALDCDSCPSGFSCENSACCGSKDAVCKQTYDAGKFGSGGVMTPRYYYSQVFKNCMLFTYYGLAGNSNNFGTYNECQRFCMH